MSLALSTLLYEWRRYMAAIVALAFSGLLVLAQVGMFMGIGKAFTATIDRARADVMVLAPGSTGLFNGGPSGVPRRIMPVVQSHPDVVAVADLDGSGGRWQNVVEGDAARKTEFVQVTIIDAVPGAVTVPTDYSNDLIEALRQPFGVAVDETALGRLGVKLGDKAIYNGKTVRVVAVTRGYPNMMQAGVVMSRDTLRMLGEANTGDRVGPLMVSTKPGADPEHVVAQLNAQSRGQFKAWTRAQLGEANQAAMFKESFIVIMLGFSLFLGILIGVAITWQTLRGAIMANIKEFASLRALGVSMGSLRAVVMELSFWVGIAGILASGVLTWAVSLLATSSGLTMAFPIPMVAGVCVMLLVIALASGFLSLGVLKKSQPADLLR
ncbi:putative ABC transport system permease protein [Brevundimonas alba]|uniref:Putative ABC transport system permease protein n=1 Tax=Brevundimonas alba TaxID=74314 RepID=A0A7X5YJ64_9CAUL|nr:ABC transporter permease [Brevundimonas alba]NJC40141.1 putative ABC transport system permease protein [Brevundimonas alba]